MVGALRFMQQGWIEELYVKPQVFFKFYGFEWVEVLSPMGMYSLYGLIALSAGCIMLGWYYRWATVVFFLTFSYSELIDSTNYLNHYYLVCLLALLLIFLPANKAYSLDVSLKRVKRQVRVPAWTINCIILQVSLVYGFAGFAKLNSDWLFRAMPLAIWLPTKADWPLLGTFFSQNWTAYAFSWAGAFYDLTIPFFLLHRKTRPLAYGAVIVFHVLTKMLFNIGLFPFIMIFNTLIFFSEAWHERVWNAIHLLSAKGAAKVKAAYMRLSGQLAMVSFSSALPGTEQGKIAPYFLSHPANSKSSKSSTPWKQRIILIGLGLFFLIQIVLPLRYLAYPGHILWTEEGYRFAWRVMLVEKVGQATFYIEDIKTGRKTEVNNRDYLTTFQEKQMSIQPDMILQFAHFLAEEYQAKFKLEQAKVTVDSHVALNGRRSQRFIKPDLDLANIKDGWAPKTWIIPYQHDH